MMLKLRFLSISIFLVIITLVLVKCGADDLQIPDRSTPHKVVTINPSLKFQEISGFGGANQMWGTQFPSSSDMKKAFDTDDQGLGFSIFRIRMSSNPEEWPLIVDVAKEAQSYGAKILASPWSPPPSLKSNESEVGGYLLEENYQVYVDHINDFLSFMIENGVQIDAISIQNEPDIEVSYESCDWTSVQMRDFIKDYGDQITEARLAAPESFNFNQSYTNVILNDDDAVANVDIVAGHIYGEGLARYDLAESKGKEIWMTEYLLNLNVGDWENASEENKWEETLTMVETLHVAMESNWNAYIWWYLKRYYSFIGDGTEGTVDGEILKRGYAFAHFSKFIRPGFVRVEVVDEDNTGLDISAFQGDGNTVVVLINDSDTFISTFDVALDGIGISSAEAFTTSLTTNLEMKTLAIEDGVAHLTMAGKSITTIVLK